MFSKLSIIAPLLAASNYLYQYMGDGTPRGVRRRLQKKLAKRRKKDKQ